MSSCSSPAPPAGAEAGRSGGAEAVCRFESPAFGHLREPRFQRSAFGTEAALVFTIDGREAALPIAAVASAFRIAPGSNDDGMIALVSRALEFRHVIELGEALPREVIDGGASWKALPRCELGAAAHLKLCILRWQGAEKLLGPLNSGMLTTADEKSRAIIQRFFGQAADAIGSRDGSAGLMRVLDDLSRELAYVQSLREGFLAEFLDVVRDLRSASRSGALSCKRDTVFQVLTLMTSEAVRIRSTLDEVEANAGNIEWLLRNPLAARDSFRAARDKVYAISVTWQAPLAFWSQSCKDADGVGAALVRLYRFVARNHIEVR